MATNRAAEHPCPLAGRHVLVTRPDALADSLCTALAAFGAHVIRAPLLVIEPLPDDAARRAIARDLDHYDIVIVTSRHAVQHGLPLLAACWPQWPVAQQWLAVGSATAGALAAQGIHAQAPADARSEGLLALPALTDVAGKRVLLLTGEGGRDMLDSTLVARGARLTRLEAYRRLATGEHTALDAFRDIPAPRNHRAVLVTSGEALQNLLARAPWLPGSDVLLVAASARIASAARAAGLPHVRNAGGADDAHLLSALRAWAAGEGTDEEEP